MSMPTIINLNTSFGQKPMTLDRAIEILNAHKHRAFDRWEIKDNGENLFAWNCYRGDGSYRAEESWLNEFEAIAIAEKYEREGAAG